MGAASRNSSVQFATVDDRLGTLAIADVLELIDSEQDHQPHVAMVAVENTHMPSGGTVWDVADLEALKGAIGARPIHLDGARLFNAVVASGVAASTIAASATTVMTCLTKGLCAPVGSLLAGPSHLMDAARVERKRLGGSMRQAGVLAAAGLVALDTMIDRLAEDHERARVLAQQFAQASRIELRRHELSDQHRVLQPPPSSSDRARIGHARRRGGDRRTPTRAFCHPRRRE